ncbi:hypothetical protein HK102_004366, partial [Quaeritorhiza haematococci]
MEEYYRANPGRLWAGVVFNSRGQGGGGPQPLLTSYALRMNASWLPSTDSRQAIATDPQHCRADPATCTPFKYTFTGLLSLQKTLDGFIMNQLVSSSIPVGTTAPFVGVAIQTNGTTIPKQKGIGGVSVLKLIVPIYVVLAFVAHLTGPLTHLVVEKEKKIKEGLLMQGLSPIAFWAAWGITYALYALIASIVYAIVFRISIFPKSDFILTFLLVVFFDISNILFGFMTSIFFSKSKTATQTVPSISLILSILYIPLVALNSSVWIRFALSLIFYPVGFTLALESIFTLETTQNGLQFDNLFMVDNGPSGTTIGVGFYLIALVFSNVLYAVMAVYLDQVVPTEYGTRRPWYYPVEFLFRSSSKGARGSIVGGGAGEKEGQGFDDDDAEPSTATNPEDIEPDPTSLHRAASIRRLTKIYSSSFSFPNFFNPKNRNASQQSSSQERKAAVDSLSFNLYEGEIFGLLGHNGSGKTSTCYMLTGLYPPTSGGGTIFGYDLRTEMRYIRQLLGVCPQHDILYDQLTVAEHIRLFAGIKGVLGGRKDGEVLVREAMEQVGLADKADTVAKHLSGGQKRKLSVAIALVGRPKILVLDEPTSGMDPLSRRQLWKLLTSTKAGRITLLTTHFMDEADILADRKAILSKGRLRCMGTSLFLKRRFQIGYHLDIVHSSSPQQHLSVDNNHLRNNGTTAAMTTLVKQFVPDAKRVMSASSVSGNRQNPTPQTPQQQPQAGHMDATNASTRQQQESRYTLPLTSTPSFPALFEALDAQPGVASYGITMPTLEDVFLKSEDGGAELLDQQRSWDEDEEGSKMGGETASYATTVGAGSGMALSPGPVSVDEPFLPKMDDDVSFQSPSFFTQLSVMLSIRYLSLIRHPRFLLIAVFFPAILLAVSFFILRGNAAIGDVPTVPLSGLTGNNDNSIASLYPADRTGGFVFDRRGFALDRNAGVGAIPPLSVSEAVAGAVSNSAVQAGSRVEFVDAAPNLTVYLMNNAPHLGGVSTMSTVATIQAAGPGGVVGNQRVLLASHLAIINDTTIHSPPMLMNFANNLLLQSIFANISSSTPAPQIIASMRPLPDTQKGTVPDPSSFQTIWLIAYALIGPAAGYAAELIRDRSQKLDFQLRIMGLQRSVYWASAWLAHWSLGVVTVGLLVVVVFAFGFKPLMGGVAVVILAGASMLYMGSLIAVFYFLSLLFKKPETFMSVASLTSLLLVIVPFTTIIILSATNPSLAQTLHVIFSFVDPPYAHTGILFYMNVLYFQHLAANGGNEVGGPGLSEYLKWENNVAPGLVAMLAHVGLFWVVMAIMRVMDSAGGIRMGSGKKKSSASGGIAGEGGFGDGNHRDDGDVVAERQRLIETEDERLQGENIVLRRVTRKFRVVEEVDPAPVGDAAPNQPPAKQLAGSGKKKRIDKWVVKDISFGVKRGECFALLGPNGAGKTTTMSMSIGALTPTSGSISIGVRNDRDPSKKNHASTSGGSASFYPPTSFKAHSVCGFCPQHDALWPRLTTREHLRVFARLKGVPAKMVDVWCDRFMSAVSLKGNGAVSGVGQVDFSDTWAERLSGGNKRKLSLAIAAVGEPDVLFLDEPSTGMDPKARRMMWNMLIKSQHRHATILTTHFMDEADALSSKIGIMVNGRLQCIGTSQHLKSKFGNGYKLEIETP